MRVLSGLDWKAAAFPDLEAARPHFEGVWALILGIDYLGEDVDDAVQRLRAQLPDAVILLVVPEDSSADVSALRAAGVDAVVMRPLQDSSVIDALGAALVKQRQ